MSSLRISSSADVDPSAVLGDDVVVWHLARVHEHAHIGAGSSIGRGADVGPGVVLGRNGKLQNHALWPRAINPDGSLKSTEDWEPVGVTVRTGAAIGARSVCVAPVEIGAWALAAAGS